MGFFTACFLTSPISMYFIVRSQRLNPVEKIIAALGVPPAWTFFLLR